MILANIKLLITLLFVVGFIILLFSRKKQITGIICILFTLFNEYFILYILLKLIGLDYIILLMFLSISYRKSKATFHNGIHKLKITPGDNIYIKDVE